MKTLGLVRGTFAALARKWVCAGVVLCGVVLIAASGGVAEDKPAVKPLECTKGNPATAAEAPAVEVDYKSTPPKLIVIDNGFDPTFDKDLDAFKTDEVPIPDPKKGQKGGLGPTFNGTSCARCHSNPVIGGSSQVSEIRAGHLKPDPNDPNPKKVLFVEPKGGSVIQQLAIDPAIQKMVQPEDTVRTLRMSNTLLGNGYIEVIPDCDILEYRKTIQKPLAMEGFIMPVQVATGPDPKNPGKFLFAERVGRFGWKSQEASLMNFSGGAYVTEMGITNPLFPTEVETDVPGKTVADFDKVKDPEDAAAMDTPFGEDVTAFTRFMRSTRVPARDATLVATADAQAGEKLFRDNKTVGCAVCHRPDYTTPAEGTPILTLHGKKGSDMDTVPKALANKTIHPYSDFLLHDIGTGDGIVQTFHSNYPPSGYESRERLPAEVREIESRPRIEESRDKDGRRVLQVTGPNPRDEVAANKMRTAPLWGLRSRPQLMHDGRSLTVEDAILRHKGQADGVRLKYEALPDAQKKQLLAFLMSL
jgi:CxxC motif-containing protein (DUF1111 family)